MSPASVGRPAFARVSPPRLALAFGVYALLTVLAYRWGELVTITLLPLLETVTSWLLPSSFVVGDLDVSTRGAAGRFIALHAVTAASVLLAPRVVPPPHFAIDVTTLQVAVLHHVIVVFSALALWPTTTIRGKAALLMLGVPCAVMTVLLDVPFVLAGLVRTGIAELFPAVASDTGARAAYALFLQSGGRFALALSAAALVAIAYCARERD